MGRGKKQRRRESLKRKAPSREPKPRILVICEGTVTEPRYLEDYSKDQKNGLVEVEAIGLGYDPKSLVDEAAERRDLAEKEAEKQEDDFLKYDDVWCVFESN